MDLPTDHAESIMLWEGIKSNCQFLLAAPDHLPPGPRVGFVEVSHRTGPRKGQRVCRFAFTIKVAASIAFLEYALGGSTDTTMELSPDPVTITISFAKDAEMQKAVGKLVSEELEKSGLSTFSVLNVSPGANSCLWVYCE